LPDLIADLREIGVALAADAGGAANSASASAGRQNFLDTGDAPLVG
jgi:hypothetical protein